MQSSGVLGQPRRTAVRVLPLALGLFAAFAGSQRLRAGEFIRGDSNGDRRVEMADALYSLSFLFLGGPPPSCPAAADSNDDELVDLSDSLVILGYLFLGAAPPAPPFPLPGMDPTPGLGCGLDAPTGMRCARRGPSVEVSWEAGPFESFSLSRDGQLLSALDRSTTTYLDHPPRGGAHTYSLVGVTPGGSSDPAACSIAGLPENRPPTLTLLAPLQGTTSDTGEVEVRGRVNDDGSVARLIVAGTDLSLPAPLTLPHEFTARIPLPPGPSLVRVEAVDDFERAAFVELALGRTPILPAGSSTLGLALDLTGTTGYSELEGILQPFLGQLASLLDTSVRGVELFRGSIVGVPTVVTGNRAEVGGPVTLDLFPSGEAGGRLGLSVALSQVTLFADGRSDYGFLGTDTWTARWTASQVTIRSLLRITPAAGGVAVASDGFVVEFGSTDLSVSGFLDPLGIFDGLVNLLADVFRSTIESQVRGAVQSVAESQLLPVLQDALGGLRLDIDLGAVALQSSLADAIESAAGLTLQFQAAWRGTAPSPEFPRYPGSAARFAPPPTFPLAQGAPHPVDATISFSADSLDQALHELTRGGLLSTAVDLGGVDSPLPLNLGTLAPLLGPRLLDLPGVAPETPLGILVSAARPLELRLGEGAVGRSIIGEGATWSWLRGEAEPPASWKDRTFDDAAWATGASGFGYSSDVAETGRLGTLLPDMQGAYGSLYLRKRFTVTEPGALTGLLLHVFYDDGFVAYLNGVEVARENLSLVAGRPRFDALADGAIEPREVTVDLSGSRSLLRAGENVLAIQGHNAALTSSDFVLLPQLLEALATPAGTLGQVPVIIDLPELTVSFVADRDGDGVGGADTDGVADELELFAYGLRLSLQGRIVLVQAEGAPQLWIQVDTADGPDADAFPDALIGGFAGIDISVAREAVDLRSATLLEFAGLVIALFAPSLGDSLAGLEIPPVPVPELAFDVNADGTPDTRLAVRAATLVPADTTGDAKADWLCLLLDLVSSPP